MTKLIGNVGELERSLRELGEHQRRLDDLANQRDVQIAAVRARFDQAATVKVGRSTVRLEARIAELHEQIELYAADHREELLAGDGKTADLVHGTLSWRAQPIRAVETEDVAARTELLEDWLKSCVEVLSRTVVKALKPITADRLVRVSLAWNKPAITDLAKSGQVNAERLTRIGFALSEPAEVLSVKTKPVA